MSRNPLFSPDLLFSSHKQMPCSASALYRTREDSSNSSSRFWKYTCRLAFLFCFCEGKTTTLAKKTQMKLTPVPIIYNSKHAMGTLLIYIMITYISFMLYLQCIYIYLIPADVLPGNSTLIGIIGALWNRSYRELYSPRKEKMTMDKIGTRNGNLSFFVLLMQTVWRLEQNMKMTVFQFWFDSNKELHYPFLGS